MKTFAVIKNHLKAAGLLLLALPAALPAADELARAREAASLGSESRALEIAMQGLKQPPPDRELFLYAVELLPEKPGAHASALAAMARAKLEKESDDYAWYLGLCKTMRAAGRAREALPNCRKALELEPVTYPPYRELGLTYAASGNQAKAVEALSQGAEISSASYQAHYQLARALENSGNYPGARRSYTRARALTRDARGMDARYYAALITAGLKRLDRKTKEAGAAEPEAPGRERLYAACLEKFRAAVRRDELAAASDLSAGCLKLVPGDPQLAGELAPLLVRLGKYEEAVKEYERAAALYAGRRDMVSFLRLKAAELWVKLGDTAKATAQYRLAAAANPADLNALKGLAAALEARSDFKAALETYEAILKLEPANGGARTRAEELKTGLLTNDQIMGELKLRKVIDEKKLVLQPEDIKKFKALRAAEISGAVDYVRTKARSPKGLSVERKTPDGTKVLLTDAGYKAYVFLATRDAIAFFERQKIGLREIFKLRDLQGEPVFDAAGSLTPEGAEAWRKAQAGGKTWLLFYETVAENPKALQANKDIAAALSEGYREISEPEYLWLLRATNCPEEVLRDKPLSMRFISDGARSRYLMCYVSNSACMNQINEKLTSYVESYREGNTEIKTTGTSNAFFGIGGTKKYRFCENGKIWNGQ